MKHSLEVADIFRAFGPAYRETHELPLRHLRAMRAIEICRTAQLGGGIWINAITVEQFGSLIIHVETGIVPSVSVWRKSGGLKQDKRIYSPLPTSTWSLPSPKDLGPWR